MSDKIIAITSCAVGVAHTYMAAENLEKAGESMGVEMKVETHGSIGVENKLTDQDVKEARGLIIAADTNIDKSRFENLQIIEVGVQKGIREPENLIQSILDDKGKTASAGANQLSEESLEEQTSEEKSSNPIYRSVMNGVSYMVPFVVTGGLLLAIGLTIGGVPGEEGLVVEEGTIWAAIENIGGAAMSFMVPILAAYMAYSIADRPGLVPGMIGGYIAVNPEFYGSAEADAGFLGGIIAGILAGYIALGIKKIKVPKAMESVMPIIFIPIISTLLVGLIFIYLIGAPIAALFEGLTNWLGTLEGANIVVLATIIGFMIAFDMGGPFNKVAFLFAVGLIGEGEFAMMGMVAVAVCIPPLGLGIASHVLKNKFDEGDKQAGKAAIAMGFFGITEGAIPFAAKDPFRVIPSIMLGTAVGTIPAALANVGGQVAHGGPIVALLGGIDGILIFFVSVTLGTIATVFILQLFKKNIEEPEVATASNTATQGSPEAIDDVESTDEVDDVDEPTSEEAVDEESGAEDQESEYKLTELISKEYINTALQSTEKEQAIEELLELEGIQDNITDKSQVIKDVMAREEEGTTGMGDAVAIPHCKTSAVKEPAVLFGKSEESIDWDSLDNEPVIIVFMILMPLEHKGDTHLKILQMLARKLMDDEFKKQLIEANTPDEIYELIEEV